MRLREFGRGYICSGSGDFLMVSFIVSDIADMNMP